MTNTNTPLSASLSRYYGLDVPAVVDEIRDEGLTDVDAADLFTAHMKANYGYFGALDKTLSGFVILDTEGDDAYLLDVRDTGAVFFQDHEERYVSVAFESLTDYVAWRAARDAARENDEDTDAVDDKFKTTTTPPSTKALSSVDLNKRLQWAVWFFAQPMGRDLGTDSVNRETRSGCNWFSNQLGTETDARFAEELPTFAMDVPLATSWLLVAAALADTKRLQTIVQHGPVGVPLFDAFAAALLPLSPSDTLEVLPVFAQRKSRLCLEYAMEGKPEHSIENYARALWAAPDVEPLQRSRLLVWLAEKNGADAAAVVANAIADAGHLVGKLARLLLDVKAGRAIHDEDLGPVCAAIADSTESQDERTWQVTMLAKVLPPREQLTIARAILVEDPYHFGMLTAVAAASTALGTPDVELIERRDALAQIRPIYVEIDAKSADAAVDKAIADSAGLSPSLRLMLAKRVLAAPTIFHPRFVTAQLMWSLTNPWPGRGAAWRDAIGMLRGDSTATIKRWREQLAEPDDDVAADLAVVLAGPIPAIGPPIIQESTRKDLAKAINAWLAQRSGPGAVDELLTRLETGDSEQQQAIIDTALNPFAKDGQYLLPRFTDAQAVRAATVLVEIQRAGKAADIHRFNLAGHQLYRFNHRGADAYLIDRLLHEERGSDLVDNLYAAVRAMGTPAARATLVSLLFAETKAFWRLSNALAEVWSDELLATLLAQIAERRDRDGIVGASRLAAAIVEHVKKVPPLLALVDLVVDWTPATDDDASRLLYTLLEGGHAALVEKNYAAARRYLERADDLEKSGVTPESDYHTLDRGRAWKNPLTATAEIMGLREQLMSGALQAAHDALKAAAVAARAAGTPNLKIKDDALSDLAGTAIASRLFVDRERGTVVAVAVDGGIVWFDGYDVVDAPCAVVVDPVLGDFFAAGRTDLDAAAGERVVSWNKLAEDFVDVVRYGRRVFVGAGVNNGKWQRHGFVFDDDAGAISFVARFRASPLKNYTVSEPWYVRGKGGIVRILYVPTGTGSDGDRVWIEATEAADVDAAEAKYKALAQQPGVRALSVEWMDNRVREADLTVHAVLAKRGRNGTADVIADLLALPALLSSSGFDPALLQITTTPPEDAALRNDKLLLVDDEDDRARLATVFATVGSVRVQVGERFATLEPLSSWTDSKTIVSRRGGAPNFTDCGLDDTANVRWLIVAFIADALLAIEPKVAERRCFAAPGDDVEHVVLTGNQGGSALVVQLMLDPSNAYVTVREGKPGQVGALKLELAADADAARAFFDEHVKKRESKGFVRA